MLPGGQPAPASGPRQAWVDNLRTAMIAAVVWMHAAVTFSHLGDWYQLASAAPATWERALFALGQSHLQAFFMGLLFLLSGLFADGALARRGPWRFLGERTRRLLGPTALYVAAINPLIYLVLLRPWWTREGFSWGSWLAAYFLQVEVLARTGPLWFCVALWLFVAAWLGLRQVRPASPGPSPRPVPGLAVVGAAALALGLVTFAVRLVQPIGTSVLNLQLPFFPQYVAAFAVGVVAGRHRWLERAPVGACRRLIALALGLGLPLWLATVWLNGTSDEAVGRLGGGWHGAALAYAVWEQWFGALFGLGLALLARDRWNRAGPRLAAVNANSFRVYVVHAPVLIALTPLAEAAPGGALVRSLLLAASTWVLCVLLCEFGLRWLPGVRRSSQSPAAHGTDRP
ncbi:MAG: acyltransferase family protein [Gemmatimonadota bacterium]